MYDAVLSLTERIVYQHSITGESPRAQGNTHPILCPYGLSRTADGFVAIATPTDHHWRELTEIMERPDLREDLDLRTNEGRLANSDRVYTQVQRWTSAMATSEVIERLTGKIPCAPVQLAGDIAADPHIASRNMINTVEHPSGLSLDIAGAPIKFSDHADSIPRRAPLLGEHNREILDHLSNTEED
jgi:crotonobetainyl-CoA:carnitine CoA-transferase CaiB-like acyl-CoA transferase